MDTTCADSNLATFIAVETTPGGFAVLIDEAKGQDQLELLYNGIMYCFDLDKTDINTLLEQVLVKMVESAKTSNACQRVFDFYVERHGHMPANKTLAWWQALRRKFAAFRIDKR